MSLLASVPSTMNANDTATSCWIKPSSFFIIDGARSHSSTRNSRARRRVLASSARFMATCCSIAFVISLSWGLKNLGLTSVISMRTSKPERALSSSTWSASPSALSIGDTRPCMLLACLGDSQAATYAPMAFMPASCTLPSWLASDCSKRVCSCGSWSCSAECTNEWCTTSERTSNPSSCVPRAWLSHMPMTVGRSEGQPPSENQERAPMTFASLRPNAFPVSGLR
mmetsp:Transcript_9752/g.22591  ORF Transcript_9752/g.22591 Transcript_9752/m.22591 type:complete len:226 (-) Transcript_9752:560-1237(-)